MTLARALSLCLAAAAGAATVFGFAPFGLSALPLATLVVLFWQWHGAASPRDAAGAGFAFGLGLFGAGASWLYIAIQSFGGMPAPLAAIAIAVLVAYLALWPAAAGWVAVRFTRRQSFVRLLVAAGAFTLAEWLRGYVFTGFPWLTVGYAQVPGGFLLGYAPVGGVFLVSLAMALCAALIVEIAAALARGARREIALAASGILALAGAGIALARIEWTRPAGVPVAVSLVQGNIVQEEKFDPGFRDATFDRYLRLVDSSRGRLVVLPESAFPVFSDQVPDDVLLSLIRTAMARDGDVLLGLFTELPPLPGGTPRYFNTVVTLGAGDPQFYRKHHLVPFGETIPLEPLFGWIIRSVLAIPLADQARGPAYQPPLEVAGQKVAVDICYEDAFGSELIPAARRAGMLVNVTNDAWYGHSIAAQQHDQIAAMRAVEFARPMLRATNTGITSAIGPDGRTFGELPWFKTGVLEVNVAGREGETPYLRFGDALVLALSIALVAAPILVVRLGRR
ncbi:MAG TPA: apolipoprotein N-acyltransferase [Casimicrobiaceae bacterium]|nr:apolipoprotein N-acyltransferase [Casimicrobiaceae bacterium]